MRQKVQTAVVIGGLLAGKLLALGRDVLFTAIFGTEDAAIAYELVGRVPTILYEMTFGGVIFGLLLPVLGRRRDGRAGEGIRLTALFLLVAIPILLLLSVLGWLLAPRVVDVITSDWSDAALLLATKLLRIQIFILPLLAISAVCTVYLQANGRLAIPTVIAVIPGAVMVSYLLFAGAAGDILVFARLFLGAVTLESFLLCGVVLLVWRRTPGDGAAGVFRPTAVQRKHFFMQTLPVLLTSWVPSIDATAVLFALGRLAPPRTVAYYGYATRLSISLTGLFSFGIGSLFFPRLLAESTDLKKQRCVTETVWALSALALPMVVGGVLLAEPGLSLLYGRGSFDVTDVRETARLLRVALLAVLPAILSELVMKLHYADGNYGRPLGGALVGMAIRLILLLPLTVLFGGVGVPLAALLAGAVRVLLGMYSLRGRYTLLTVEDFPRHGTVLTATAGMLLAVGACYRLHVLLQLLIGVGSYSAILFLMSMLQKKRHVSQKTDPFTRV